MTKETTGEASVIPTESIENRIFLLRGQKVMLSTHIAELFTSSSRLMQPVQKTNGNANAIARSR